MHRVLLDRYRNLIADNGSAATDDPRNIIATEGRTVLRYIPFEHVERAAQLVIVGISPGPNQMSIAYDAFRQAALSGLSDADAIRTAKFAAGFGGPLRRNLIRMLDHFRIHAHLGLSSTEELWEGAPHLLHSTSVIPHAAFIGCTPFAGSFSKVMSSRVLRESFESDFMPTLEQLGKDALYIALGPTPHDALLHCADLGLIDARNILGSLAHPSGSGGSQIRYFLRELSVDQLSEKDPVRNRIARLDHDYSQLHKNTRALGMSAMAAPAAPSTRNATSAPRDNRQPNAATGREHNVPDISGLHAFVARGEYAGIVLRPHLHPDGTYIVSLTRYEDDYVRVSDPDELKEWIAKGYSVRMSNPLEIPGRPPSLIAASSIRGLDEHTPTLRP